MKPSFLRSLKEAIAIAIALLALILIIASQAHASSVGGGKTSEAVKAAVLPLFHTVQETGSLSITITSYNPEAGQTDDSPCIGAALVDLCKRDSEGGKIMALSQDLVGRSAGKPFHYGDIVRVKSPCVSGDFLVLDTMNKRFQNRGDIFFKKKKDGIGICRGTVAKIFPKKHEDQKRLVKAFVGDLNK